jgi:hypothetical protein
VRWLDSAFTVNSLKKSGVEPPHSKSPRAMLIEH